MNIGWLNLSGGFHFEGSLDEVAIYNRALSPEEISTHYNNGSGLFTEPVPILPVGNSITKGSGTCQTPDDYLNCVGYRAPLWDMLTDAGYFVDFVGDQGGYYQYQYIHDNNHLGYGGWTDGGIAGIVYDRLEKFQPAVVLLHIGTNSPDPAPSQVEEILDEVDRYEYDYGKPVTVILARIITKATAPDTIAEFNTNVVNMAAPRIAGTDGGTAIPGTSPVEYYRAPGVSDKIRIVDMEPPVVELSDLPDGVHPDADGYYKMAQVWYNELTQVLTQSFDTTPPSAPTGLSATAQNESAISLSWDQAADAESDIASYHVYRDGTYVAETSGTTYLDDGLSSSSTFYYEVSAVNGAGLEGGRSVGVTETTPADTIAPAIDAVSASEPERVIVRFSEPVEQTSAETISNYAMDNGVTVSSAILAENFRAVVLTVSTLTEGITYTLTITGVKDLAVAPNSVNELVSFTAGGWENRIADGLVVRYDFKEGSGATVHDVSDTGTPMDLTMTGDVVWTASGSGVVVNGSGALNDGLISSGGSADKLINALQAKNQSTIEAWIESADLAQSGPSRIISIKIIRQNTLIC